MKFPVSQYRKRKFPEYRKLRVFGKSEQNQPIGQGSKFIRNTARNCI